MRDQIMRSGWKLLRRRNCRDVCCSSPVTSSSSDFSLARKSLVQNRAKKTVPATASHNRLVVPASCQTNALPEFLLRATDVWRFEPDLKRNPSWLRPTAGANGDFRTCGQDRPHVASRHAGVQGGAANDHDHSDSIDLGKQRS